MQQKENTTSDMNPICVDMDGTLIRSDLLVEGVLSLIKRNVLYVFMLPIWLLAGKANLKHEIATRVDLDVSLLPYNPEFLSFLRVEKGKGRTLVLATASHIKLADAVAEFLGIFDRVLASDWETNLSGKAKLLAMDAAFGAGKYDYAGNSKADLAVFAGGAGIILVNPEKGVHAAAGKLGVIKHNFSATVPAPEAYFKALRPHQWLKNALVFVPLLLAHLFGWESIWSVTRAFIAFGLCASSVYLLNDLLDLPDDRAHHTKKHRPLAAGTIPILHGVAMIPVLLFASFALAMTLRLEFVAVLASYYVVTLSYSLFFKRTMLFDVIVLAGLYTLRIVAGAAALGVPRSSWLLAFSVFLFFSLALVKRYVELGDMKEEPAGPLPLATRARGYRVADRETLSQLGITSGLLAVLVLALYIDTTVVKDFYTRPELLWLVCPLILYLVSRIWMLARRGDMEEDPLLFAIKDWRSQIVLGLGVGIVFLAAV